MILDVKHKVNSTEWSWQGTRKTSFEWVTANTSPAQRMLLKKRSDVEKTKSKKLAYSILRPIFKQSISPQSNRLCVTFLSCSCYGVWATTTATATRTAKNCSTFFNIYIFCRCWATIAWKCSIFRLVEDVNSPNQFTNPLFSLLSPSSARDKKKPRRIYWPPAQGGNGGGRRK